ncbi:MAG TPA: response regulator transcription factor [Dermatophilaceae bacterium]|nr:response regulator transcription factor [Dermatophilaceae bacterium]
MIEPEEPPVPLRVVVCDDSGIFREGLALLLEAAGVAVVGSVDSVPRLMGAVVAEHPDLAVIDIRLPPTHTTEGLSAALDLHQRHPELGILVLSTYVEALWVFTLLDAFDAGIGYLLKDRVDNVDALVGSLRRVSEGGIAMDLEVITRMIAAGRRGTVLDRLTERELDVLHLLAEGRSNAGIAASLRLAVKTVEGHVASAFRALDLEPVEADNRRVKAALAFLAAHDGRGNL